VFITEFYKLNSHSRLFKHLHAGETATCNPLFFLYFNRQMCTITHKPSEYLNGNGRYRRMGKVPVVLGSAGLCGKQILH